MEAKAFDLKHYQEFKNILADYHVSDHAKSILDKTQLVLMSGPFAGGRNTLINRLVETGRYTFIVSDTTRPRQLRDGKLEKSGVQYWFRTEEEILADLKKGEFLEAEIIHEQQVSGISIRELEKASAQNKVAVNEVEIGGIQNVMSIKPDTIAIILLPPSYEEWQRRAEKRGKIAPEDYNRRMRSALKIFKIAMERSDFNFIISENVDDSARAIDLLMSGQPNPHQQAGRELIKDFYAQTLAALS